MASFYIANEYWFAVFQLVLAMLGMGATLTGKDFRDVMIETRAVSIGMAVQLLAVPLLAYAFIHALGLVPGMAISIALLAAIPGGTVSNVFTFFARGNTALSITITALTTVACLITTPLILELLIGNVMAAEFDMPVARIAQEIGLCLLLPLVVGMVILALFPAQAPGFSKWCIRGSLLGILAITLGALSAGRLDLDAFGLGNTLLVIAFMGLLALVAWLTGRGAGLQRADNTAIGMEVIVRNINLGILIKASLFPAATGTNQVEADLVLFTMLLYGGLQLAAGGGLIALARRVSRSP